MADPLTWKPGEGYDLHVVRGGPSSKPLASTVNLPAHHALATPTHTPPARGHVQSAREQRADAPQVDATDWRRSCVIRAECEPANGPGDGLASAPEYFPGRHQQFSPGGLD